MPGPGSGSCVSGSYYAARTAREQLMLPAMSMPAPVSASPPSCRSPTPIFTAFQRCAHPRHGYSCRRQAAELRDDLFCAVALPWHRAP